MRFNQVPKYPSFRIERQWQNVKERKKEVKKREGGTKETGNKGRKGIIMGY